MAISKARKDELVAQYKQLIDESDAIILAEYDGMNVKMMQGLRSKLREVDGSFHVTKNTLLKIALKQNGKTVPDDLLVGQVGTGFAMGEVPTMAKAFVDFAKKEDNLTIKGGIFGDDLLTSEGVEALAKLPTLDQLRGQLIGLISTPAQGLVGVLGGGVRQVVNVIDAYAKSEDEAAEAA